MYYILLVIHGSRAIIWGGGTIFLQHKYNYNQLLYLTKNVVIIVGVANQCDKWIIDYSIYNATRWKEVYILFICYLIYNIYKKLCLVAGLLPLLPWICHCYWYIHHTFKITTHDVLKYIMIYQLIQHYDGMIKLSIIFYTKRKLFDIKYKLILTL